MSIIPNGLPSTSNIIHSNIKLTLSPQLREQPAEQPGLFPKHEQHLEANQLGCPQQRAQYIAGKYGVEVDRDDIGVVRGLGHLGAGAVRSY
jgi:hypothetical protein